jgi:hypothetical protein
MLGLCWASDCLQQQNIKTTGQAALTSTHASPPGDATILYGTICSSKAAAAAAAAADTHRLMLATQCSSAACLRQLLQVTECNKQLTAKTDSTHAFPLRLLLLPSLLRLHTPVAAPHRPCCKPLLEPNHSKSTTAAFQSLDHPSHIQQHAIPVDAHANPSVAAGIETRHVPCSAFASAHFC